jgi:hypothetical protein
VGTGGLELVCMVWWCLRRRLGGGVALLAASNTESLAEECEAVGEARPPRSVARINCFHCRYDGSFMPKLHWDSRVSDLVCNLRGTVPWWRSSRCYSSLQRAATSVRPNVADDSTVHGWLLLAPLSVGGGVVFCCVRCLCVLFVVVFASARHVQLLVLLI